MADGRYAELRQNMVYEQLVARGIQDDRVLTAMKTIPRHLFLPYDLIPRAYDDCPLPIGFQQTISQPYIVAFMTQILNLDGTETVLEIGTGSGYQAAILGSLARIVYSVERIPELAEQAIRTLQTLEIENVHVVVADGTLGLPEHSPYDAIMVTAGAPAAPEPLKAQLSEGGCMVIPSGGRGSQYLERWIRHGDSCQRKALAPVAFVPLIGEHGWPQSWCPVKD